MPLAAAMEGLKAAYRGQCTWLLAWAGELETGRMRVITGPEGAGVDISLQTARDYRHRAANLESIIAAYERLDAKGSTTKI